MLGVSVWRRVLGLCRLTVIEDVWFDFDADVIVADVRARKGRKGRCGRCGLAAPGYDQGEGRRRWRTLDLGPVRCFLEAAAPRVNCPVHGPTVAEVPWARHGAGHTRAFDDTVAWTATRMSVTAAKHLLRVGWSTVGAIVQRVAFDAWASRDPLEGLTRIGIDEISYKRGHRYLTVVVDHDTGRLVWAAVGRDKATLGRFFDELGDERCRRIRLVSCDAADWIAAVVRVRCRNATICLDAFHLVRWVTDALDQVRRDVWNQARRAGLTGEARDAKQSRFVLRKNPESLTARQQTRLASIAETNKPLYRAYLLKEQFREAVHVKGHAGIAMLHDWLQWASRSRLPPFVDAARAIRNHLPGIEATMVHGLSNALVESTNTKIRVLTRTAYGFANPEHLIALALLARGGWDPPLPGRTTP